MKKHYVSDLRDRLDVGQNVTLYGWIKSKRVHRNTVFLDIVDSTGAIQAIYQRDGCSAETFTEASCLTPESAVKAQGELRDHSGQREILGCCLSVISRATLNMNPRVRDHVDIFDPGLQEHLLSHRHFYLRNEKLMALLKFRHILMGEVHQWFRSQQYTEITAPILTAVPLYEGSTAMGLRVDHQDIYLTQCVGFYLEWAAHAFEKVYNIGPSFRGEESRSKRHLMEYWHIKAEMAFADLEDVIETVESLISSVSSSCVQQGEELMRVIGKPLCLDGLKPPYPRVSYSDAVDELKRQGLDFEFGKSLGSEEEALLSKDYRQPFWVVGIPRSIEPFPYAIDSSDVRVTRTADLIATNGYGELLGVAEKIQDLEMLDERLAEKGKTDDAHYEWMRDLRKFGSVPHVGFGLGVERFIRWLTNTPHVRDTIPFPRTFRRKIFP